MSTDIIKEKHLNASPQYPCVLKTLYERSENFAYS